MTATPPLASVDLWTDGGCAPNPGPGGWAFVLLHGRHRKPQSGHEPDTTNNRMELMAVIRGLRALNRPCRVTIHLDSAYVMDAITKNWIAAWKRRGWKTTAKQPVKNRDLWEQLEAELARHQVTFAKVKGHSGVTENEFVDQLAGRAIRNDVVH